MSAANRLWRRAPLWRLSLAAALTFTVLTALYPPPQLRRATAGWLTPTPTTPKNVVSAPPLDEPPEHGTTRLAGRLIPLPPGDWRPILAARFNPGPEVSEIVLARIEHGQLTGLLDAAGTTTPTKAVFGLAHDCLDPTDYAAHIVPPGTEAGRECWLVHAPIQAHPHTIADAALDRLRQTGVDLGPPATTAAWFRTIPGEFLTVRLDLPGAHPAQVQTWMTTYAKRLSHAFAAPT